MTISSTTRKAGPYSGTGAQVAFPFAFKVFKTSDVLAVRTDSTGTETPLQLGTDYAVALNSDQNANPGGTVTLSAALAAGFTLTLTSQLQYLQPLDITNQGGFYPRVITDALDRITIFVQQLYDAVSRSLKVSISTPAGVNSTLPAPVPYQLIGWNKDGNGFQNTDPTYSTALATDLANANDLTRGVALVKGAARVVSSIAALRTLPKAGSPNCLVTGYYAAGDGGGGFYYYDVTDAASPDNGGTIIAAADGGRWKLTSTSSGVSVKQFGAKGDGVTDDSNAIQAAINWRLSAGGAVLLPAGNYLISKAISWTGSNLMLVGEGKGATTITASFAAGDIVVVGDGVANPNNCVVQALRITATVAKTSGAAIRFRNGHNLKARDVRLDGNLFKGIALDGGPQHFSYYVQEFEISASSVGIELGSDGTLVADVFITSGIIGAAAQGLLCRYASGVYASRIDAISCTDCGIAIIPGNGQAVTSSFFDTVLGDTCANQGWKIIPTGTGKVADISLENCWGSSTTNAAGAGLYVDGPAGSVSNLQFSNFRAVNNAGAGILLNQGRFLTFSNCIATSNSQKTANTYHGLTITASLTDIQIVGGVYGGANTLPQQQCYGISFGGACDYIQIIGANTRGNSTGGLTNASSGTHNQIANNV